MLTRHTSIYNQTLAWKWILYFIHQLTNSFFIIMKKLNCIIKQSFKCWIIYDNNWMDCNSLKHYLQKCNSITISTTTTTTEILKNEGNIRSKWKTFFFLGSAAQQSLGTSGPENEIKLLIMNWGKTTDTTTSMCHFLLEERHTNV